MPDKYNELEVRIHSMGATVGQYRVEAELDDVPIGKGELPQFPLINVVMPWRTALSALGLTRRFTSLWSCTSMNPGETARPDASMTLFPRDAEMRPTSTMIPLSTATSP